MKYVTLALLALPLLVAAGCSEESPLESGTKLDSVNPIPGLPHSAPYFASWTTTTGLDLPDIECDPMFPANVFAIFGEGYMTHLGASTFDSISSSNPEGVQDACSVLTAANGDELWATTIGISGQSSPTVIWFSGQITYDGGTGRFENATGSGEYAGTFDFVTMT